MYRCGATWRAKSREREEQIVDNITALITRKAALSGGRGGEEEELMYSLMV